MKPDWDDNSVWMQSMILAYDHIRQYEEAKRDQMLMKASIL
jgi:hypothetical protein